MQLAQMAAMVMDLVVQMISAHATTELMVNLHGNFLIALVALVQSINKLFNLPKIF